MLHAKLTDFQESPSIGQIYIQRNTTTESMEEIQQSMEVMSALDEIKVHVNNEKQEIGQYWKISNDGASLHVVVMEKRSVYGPFLWAKYRFLSLECLLEHPSFLWKHIT